MSRLLLVLGVVAACSSSPAPSKTTIYVTDDAPAGVRDAVDDVRADLGKVVGEDPAISSSNDVGCRSGELHLVVRGITTDLPAKSYAIQETRCGDGHLVVVRGGSLLAAQWGIYDVMERVGIRYFHPEQTLYPAALVWPNAPIDVVEAPAIAERSLHLHTTHPVELSPPLDASPADSLALQKHWVAWNVKVRHDSVDGVDLASAYAWERGFPRGAGLNLVETQQGGVPVIDPNDPRPETDQMAAAIDAQMAPVAGQPAVSNFNFSFNPSEFTTAPEQQTVDRISFVTSYIHDKWPDVATFTVNHGTYVPPGPVFGVRFFDLSEFAPPELGVEVHPLMFYDLDRAAPVYGNDNFHMLRDFIVDQQSKRRITYFPETSWWLTFDLPVPLFLAPVSLEARDHDIALLAPYVKGTVEPTGVTGHKSFTSGQEWGYWLIDYCTARMTWQIDLGWTGCLDEVGASFVRGDEMAALLAEVGRAQVDPMRDPEILKMLVGSDDGTETAFAAGIVFHPLPPAPVAMLSWDDAAVAYFQDHSLTPLAAMADQYAGWATRADELAAAQDDARRPWFSEIADGLRITGLRVKHAQAVYSTVLALRAAIAAHDYAAVDVAAAGVDAARAITEQARVIVAAREAGYRYPLALSTVGDEVGTPGAVPNQTIYPYRYLSRTHRLFYWTRPDEQLAALFGFDVVAPNDRMLKVPAPLDVSVTAGALDQLSITWGDGTTSTMLEPHTYAAQGVYDWTLDALQMTGVIHHVDRVAIVARKLIFPKGSVKITAPMGGSIIAGLLPGFAIGLGTDGGGDFTALGQLDTAATAITNGTVQRRARTATTDLAITLGSVGTITIKSAAISIDEGTGVADRHLTITGQLSTDEIIQLVVHAGGFDLDGARSVVAGTLGYTVDTLPALVDFTSTAIGSDQ